MLQFVMSAKRAGTFITPNSSAAPPQDRLQLLRQLGDKMLAIPGALGFMENALPRLIRQMLPSRDHAGAQPAHQTFILGRIFELLFFHERHAHALLLTD